MSFHGISDTFTAQCGGLTDTAHRVRGRYLLLILESRRTRKFRLDLNFSRHDFFFRLFAWIGGKRALRWLGYLPGFLFSMAPKFSRIHHAIEISASAAVLSTEGVVWIKAATNGHDFINVKHLMRTVHGNPAAVCNFRCLHWKFAGSDMRSVSFKFVRDGWLLDESGSNGAAVDCQSVCRLEPWQ